MGPETAATAGEAHRARFEQAERFDGKNSARKEIIYGSDGEKDDEDRPLGRKIYGADDERRGDRNGGI